MVKYTWFAIKKNINRCHYYTIAITVQLFFTNCHVNISGSKSTTQFDKVKDVTPSMFISHCSQQWSVITNVRPYKTPASSV